jgi:hypothetical protein
MVMSDTSAQSSRGKFRRAFRVGDVVGTPLEQWAYYTPRFPAGIAVSDLGAASPDVQRETALIWFYSNFKRYELGPGPHFGFAQAQPTPAATTSTFSDGSRFSDGSSFTQPAPEPTVAGFDQAPFAPVPVEALAALDAEFADVLEDGVRRTVADALPGEWMRSWSGPAIHEVGEGAPSLSELGAAILTRLDLLQQAISELRPIRGGIGHNRPPAGSPFTAREQEDLRALIDRTRASVAGGGAPASDAAGAASGPLHALRERLGTWLLGQVNTFVTEANKAVAKETGKLVWAALAWAYSRELIALLQQLENLARH